MSAIGYQFKRDFNEFDPDKKDVAWANRLVSQFRIFMEPLVDRKEAAINRSYLDARQDCSKYSIKFHEPEKLPFKFEPLGLFEKTRNILSAEREKAGIYLQLQAQDPTAQEEKQYDQKLLQNSGFIEDMLSMAQLSMGLPEYSIANDKTKEGEKIANGNLDAFTELKLDPNSPEDIAYFMQAHYRLDVQAEGEDAVNFFVKTNELQELLKDWIDDCIAIKAIAGRVYCDEINHVPQYKYLRPENVRWIKGMRRDGKDARAIMVEENMTIAELLGKSGTQLTPENVMTIIDSVNFNNATFYDGLSFSNGTTTMPSGCSKPCDYDTFMNMKVGVGYLEWKSIECKTKKVGRNSLGNFKAWTMPYAWEPAKENENYKKETNWNVVTYKTYFVARTTSDQMLFNFGKLFDMNTYGSEDEYSSFSFQVYVQPGPSAVKIARPFIDAQHDAFFRFLWILNKAKPKGTRYNYNVIAKIATKMYRDDNEENGVMKVIKMFQDSIDDFYVNDSLNPNVGGGQNPHFEKPNGLDVAIRELWQVFKDQEGEVSDKLGINSVREAYSPNPNDGYKLQMQALAQSRNATEYISRMIMSVLMNFAKHTLTIVQDMIEFKGSESYKYIERALGIKNIRTLSALKKMPLHKFGIIVQSFNDDQERAQFKQDAKESWQKGEIPYHVYVLISTMDNIKKAAHVLAYEKGRELKNKQAEAERLHQQQMEQITAAHQAKMDEIQAEIDGKLQLQGEYNKGTANVADINAQNDLEVKSLSINSEPMKAGVRTQGKIATDQAKARIDRGEPVDIDEI